MPAAYVVQAINLAADLAGWKAPTRSMVATVQVEQSVLDWVDRTFAALPPAPRAELTQGKQPARIGESSESHRPPGDPQSGGDEGVSTPSQNIPTSAQTRKLDSDSK